MTRTTSARLLVTLMLVATLGGCGGGEEPASPESRVAADNGGEKEPLATGAEGPNTPDGDGSGTDKKKGAEKSSGDQSEEGFHSTGTLGEQAGGERPGGRKNDSVESGVGVDNGERPKGSPRERDTSASMKDPSGDAEGEGQVPSYMDLTNIRLVREEGLQIVLAFAKALPARMPDKNSNMIAGIDLRIGKKEMSIYAEGTDGGWRPRSSETDASSFPGSLSLSGNTLQINVSDSFLEKSGRFTWYGHSSWTKSTLTSTDYAFDQAPDVNRAEFPN